jgi:hypothetical protein
MSHDVTSSEPLLTTRQLNRALLARQYLLERVPSALPAALEQVAGLPAQHGSAYLGLWARLSHFERDALTAALEDRSVIQASLMRQTIYVVSQHDFVLMAAGVRRARREWWLRVSRSRGLDETAYRNLADKLATTLKDEPRTRAELLEDIEGAGYPKHAFEGVVLWLDLVRIPPYGTWDHPKADLFGLAADWVDVGSTPIEAVDVSDGLDLLVQRYFRAFGPAPLGDVASWAGVPAASLEPSIERLDLRRFCDEAGTLLLDLPFGPLPDPDTPAPVRFLPTWDAVHLVHAKRAAIVSEENRKRALATTTPSGVGTFLVDGAVAGTWTFTGEQVETEAFSELPATARDEVAAEATRLAELFAD